jgi:hypothetical protein
MGIAMTNQNDRRCSERSSVMLSATLEQRAACAQVRLSNLSREGAAIIGSPLAPYSRVVLRREGSQVASRVMWVDGSSSGVRFEQPTELESLLPRISRRRPSHALRPGRPGLKCAPLSDADRLVLERWSTAGTSAPGD